jgi:hypothetical protein
MNKLILLLSIIFLLQSCSKTEIQEQLNTADSVMHEHPDSALTIINEIDTTRFENERQQAFYNLLLTEALYKNYLDLPDESKIAFSCNYFANKGQNNYLMRALFMESIIQLNNSDLTKSVVTALKAKEIAQEENNCVYLGKICEHISDIYNLSYNVVEELNYVIDAARYYKKAGKTKNFICSTIDRARAYRNNGRDKECVTLVDSILPFISSSDKAIKAYAYESKIFSLISLGMPQKAKECLDSLKKYADNCVDSSILLDVALVNNNIETANALADSIIDGKENPTIARLTSLYHYFKKQNNYEKALFYYERLMDIQNKTVRITLQQNVEKAQKDYFAETAASTKLHSQQLRLWLYSSIFVALAIIQSLVLVHRIRLKRKISDIENKIQEIDNLSYTIKVKEESIFSLNEKVEINQSRLTALATEINQKDEAISKMEDKVNNLYKSQFNTLNELCGEFFAKNDASEKVRLSLYKEVESQILKLRNKKSLQELENSLNLYNNNIALKLTESFPLLKPIDRTFLLLTFAGLSSKAICIICDITIGNYYNKRQRLRNKIAESDAKYKKLFLENMR